MDLDIALGQHPTCGVAAGRLDLESVLVLTRFRQIVDVDSVRGCYAIDSRVAEERRVRTALD